METVLFCCSIVACLIGVLTFVVGMNGRSKEDGVLVQKINQAIEGIEELKTDVKQLSTSEQSLALLVNSHEEQIKTLFRMHDKEILRLHYLKGKDFRYIGDTLGYAEVTIKKRHAKALAKLNKLF